MSINEAADWQHLGRWFAEERNARGLNRADAAQAAGIGYQTLRKYEGGVPQSRVTDEMRKLAQLYDWAPGSIETVLAGGRPTYVDRATAVLRRGPSESAARVLDTLRGASAKLTAEDLELIRSVVAELEGERRPRF